MRMRTGLLVFLSIVAFSGCTGTTGQQGEPLTFTTVDAAEKIAQPTAVNGQLYYVVRDGYQEYIASEGKRVSPGYGNIDGLTAVNGKLTYLVRSPSDEFVVYDGQKQPAASNIHSITSVNGQLAYVAEEDGDAFVVVGGENRSRFDAVNGLTTVNGNVAYAGLRDGVWHIVHGNAVTPTQHDRILEVEEVGGKIAYIAEHGDTASVVHDGQQVGSTYKHVQRLTAVNGNAAFVAETPDRDQFVVYDGIEQHRYQRILSGPKEIQGQLMYVADDGAKNVVVQGENAVVSDRDVIDVAPVNGKLTYTTGSHKQAIMYGDTRITPDYTFVLYPQEINGKLTFIGVADDAYHLVQAN